MRLVLKVQYADGSAEYVRSDGSWEAAAGPITYSSIYGGEDYDARLEKDGWCSPVPDEQGWQPAVRVSQDIRLKSQIGTEMRPDMKLPVVRKFVNRSNNTVYDFGQNFSGIIRVRVKGPQGSMLKFHPGELLNADSTVNQSATGHPYYFKYTLKGGGDEVWEPRFSYYGFRYVEVETGTDSDSLPEVMSIEGIHMAAALPVAGTFRCSDGMFNRVHELIDWAVRSNTASVLTDCPHREKLGWLEQAHLMQPSIQYRYATPLLYEKMMSDMAVSQTEAGVIPTIAPELVRFKGGFEDTPEWRNAFIISPWNIYKWYGDRRPIETYYPAMKRFIDYLGSRAQNHIVSYGLGDWYDLGPKEPGYAQLTSNGVTVTAIYYHDVTLMSRMARLLGLDDDAAAYDRLAADIRKAYNDTFYHPETASYDSGSQTANAISLYMGLVEDEKAAAVLESLKADIRGRGYALTAGDMGYRYVLQALHNAGADDVIYRMNSRYDVPGYGWQLAHGATTLTESWQAYGFVSNNHFMLGHLMEWLYGGVGGLRQADNSVAFKRLYIDPYTSGDITGAQTTYESPYGRVECEWKNVDGLFTMRVRIPANSSAVIRLPAASASDIREHGAPIDRVKCVKCLGSSPTGHTELEVGSGDYLFTVSPRG